MAKHDTNSRGMTGTCATGKVCYDKQAAKSRARFMRRRDRDNKRGHVTAFKCREPLCIYWHIGHLPKAVETGFVSRDTIRTRGEIRGQN